jgi:hypothetical protein
MIAPTFARIDAEKQIGGCSATGTLSAVPPLARFSTLMR